jgi:hypothetical protein
LSKKITTITTRAELEARVRCLEIECSRRIEEIAIEYTHRTELLGGLPFVFGELIKIAPPKERAALSRAIFAVGHNMDLTAETLRAILTCAMVLQDRFLAKGAA